MNSNTVYKTKNYNSVYFEKKSDENNPNRSEMENDGLQDSVDIDLMVTASTLQQYANMEYNNEYYYPLMNSKCHHQKTHQSQY